MKRIKSNHLWRRGATLLLAMLMLFTCVGSALPAFAEEAAGNTATVDSGDPVLADSSASGDSTGDTGTDLPDDPQRPTLPSGEDISEEAPPADESDGETVPPADSDSSEDPAAPDSGDSIPDESESEPAEQPGEGDADLPEDEQPSGEEPDPDEDEEIPENEPEDEPFEALVILDPENGAAVQAGVGEEVTFKAPVSREDVAVAYQWQRFQKPAAGSVQTEALYDYAEGETTEYWYALDDMREAEALAMNPDMLWPGIEMYYATVAALDEIGADSSDVSIAWKTPNFALEGYTISAAETESGIEVYADKDDERHVAHLNENSEWEFGEAEEKPETTGAWLNIEGANGPEYAFTVEERDYDASFRCEVTVLDEVYLEQCLSILEEQGIELTEEQRAAEQKLYSVVMSVENGKEEALPEDEPMTFSMARSMLRAAASGKPQLSADAQWIEGLDGNYQYITKDTYDRVSEWLAKGEITETQAARYWTYLRPKAAGVLDGDCLRQTVDKIDPAHPLSESLVYKDEYDFGTAFSVGDFVEGGEDKGLALKVTGLQAQPATWRLVPLSTTSMKRGELMMSLAPESAISNASAIDLSACSAETDITERGWFMSAPEVDENGIVQPDKATLLPMTTFAQMAGGNVNDAGCSPVVKVTYTVTPMFDIDDGQTETVGGDAVTSNR